MKNIKDTEFFSKVMYVWYRIKCFIGYENYKHKRFMKNIKKQIEDSNKFIEEMTKKIRGGQ